MSRWLDDPATPTPAELLDDAGYAALASALRGAQMGAAETRDGIYQTARTAAKCLHDPQIMAWVTPPEDPRLPCFDPARFAGTRDALYLITESRSAASPLIAGITDLVMRAGRRRAEQAGGRLDPPMVLVLDEAANICKIADLPDLYSHLGSRGIIPVTILQSYEQGESVWGAQGMAALWGSATKKLIGAGVDSPRLTRDLAVLVGHHDVPVRSVSVGDGRASEQISWQRRLILEAADIRSIEQGTALLLASGTRPACSTWSPGPPGPTPRASTRPGCAPRPPSSAPPGPAPSAPRRPTPPQREHRGGGIMTADLALAARRGRRRAAATRCTPASRTGSTGTSCRCTAGRSAGSSGGARNGGCTRRRSPGSPPCGSPGRRCGSSPAPARSPGSGTTSTTSFPVLLGRSGPFAQCTRRSTSSPAWPSPSRRRPAGGSGTRATTTHDRPIGDPAISEGRRRKQVGP